MAMPGFSLPADVAAACFCSLPALVEMQARLHPGRVALQDAEATRDYATLARRAAQAASALAALDGRGTRRFAILSENRLEYPEIVLAAGRMDAVLACVNWRLTPAEIADCLALVELGVLLVSPRQAEKLSGALPGTVTVTLGKDWEARLRHAEPGPAAPVGPETPWLILYTGGTTGRPKGATLSHRAEFARMLTWSLDLGLAPGGTVLAWPPMYHIGGTEPALHALSTGGRVIVEDGFDADRIARHVAREHMSWLPVMPGTAGQMADALERLDRPPAGIGACGVMPDLLPAADIARLTARLGAPYCNTFGATETGTPPFSSGRIAPGDPAPDLGKLPSPFFAFRLADEDGRDVADGETGAILVRGPTLFSGYWNDAAATARDFAGGWFRMGDLFRRRPDGRFAFMDRSRYIVKSGGENIYPAEIERVLMSDPHVADAAVVRRRDARWGEVPVALVVARAPGLDTARLAALCRAQLAAYKQPRQIIEVEAAVLARNPGGKLARGALERWVEESA